jgi:hypothetical protein
MRLLEESSLRLLELSHDVKSPLTKRKALPPEKAPQTQRLVLDLRSRIGQMKSDLAVEESRVDVTREAAALIGAMTVSVEELHPRYLKGYGKVPEALGSYVKNQIAELLRALNEINQTLGEPHAEVTTEG